MTISLLLPNITSAIAALSISGVTIKDTDQIVASWQSQPHVLYPNPEGFITAFSLTYQSFTRGASSDVDIRYTLNYRYLGTAIGDGSQLMRGYDDMVTKVAAIVAKFIETTAPYDGKVDLTLGPISIGARSDPAGNMYHGADFALLIMEMQNT